MSKLSWQESLRASLQNQSRSNNPPRVVVLGIGHELRGDDAVGLVVAARLKTRAADCDRLLAVEGGAAPENCTGTLRRFRPNLVVLVDAAFMDAPAGAIGWLSWQDASGFSASTHTLPLHLLATYLTSELGCEVTLIGIQPAQLEIDAPLTPAVAQAAEEFCKFIMEEL